ncbi:uncharacterized protein [Oscarella lobularis]|uniref:uncharacterized protein isoform X2 n=1 Tax=Oscarella lobularis TaxID=121494 RepID=UPI003313DEDF
MSASPHWDDGVNGEHAVVSLVALCLAQAPKLRLDARSVASLPRNLLQRVFRAYVEQEALDATTIDLFGEAECAYVQLSPHYVFQDVADAVINGLARLQGVRVLDLWNCRLSSPDCALRLVTRHASLSTLLLNQLKDIGTESSGGRLSFDDSIVSQLKSLTRLCLGHLVGFDLDVLKPLELLEELYLIHCHELKGVEALQSHKRLQTLQYSDEKKYCRGIMPKKTFEGFLSLSSLSCLILTNVALRDEYIESMTDMDNLKFLDVSFTYLSSSGLCLMLSHARRLKSCVCMGIKLPAEVTTNDLFGGAAPPGIRVISNRSRLASRAGFKELWPHGLSPMC